MDKKEIEKIYIEKIDRLKKFDKAYFDEDKPIISDKDYDHIKQEVIDLEGKYSYLKNKNSPSQKVGYKPSSKFKKVDHDIPMLSLANAFSKENIEDFLKKIKNFLNIKNSDEIVFSAEPKIDGISASLKYINGVLTFLSIIAPFQHLFASPFCKVMCFMIPYSICRICFKIIM